jgi:hypothetical protein
MGDVVYRSEVEVERIRGPQRRAWLPGLTDHITFGVHSEIAEHYKVASDVHPPDATTIDYLVSAVAG